MLICEQNRDIPRRQTRFGRRAVRLAATFTACTPNYANNRRTETIDANGNAAAFNYDLGDNLTSTTDANGHTVTHMYDADDCQTQLMAPNGHSTTFGLDPVGNRTLQTDLLGQKTTFTYDADNRVSVVTDAMSQVSTHTWDNVNRPTGAQFADGRAYGYAYDGNSNRTLMTEPTGAAAWAFDPADRLTAQNDAAGTAMSFAYYDDNRRTAQVMTGVGTFTYGYDNADRMVTIANPANETTTQVWDADSRMTQRQLANGITSSFSSDEDNRTTLVAHALGPTMLYSYSSSHGYGYGYGYDKLNNRTGAAMFSGGSGSVPIAIGIPARFYLENSLALAMIGPYLAEFLSSPGKLSFIHNTEYRRHLLTRCKRGILLSSAVSRSVFIKPPRRELKRVGGGMCLGCAMPKVSPFRSISWPIRYLLISVFVKAPSGACAIATVKRPSKPMLKVY